MIYIVEIPHQMPAKCWSKYDENDVLQVAHNIADRRGGLADFCDIEYTFYDEHGNVVDGNDDFYECKPNREPNFQDAIDFLADDLNSMYAYKTAAEAVEALKNGEINGHQCFKARNALREEIANCEPDALLEGGPDELRAYLHEQGLADRATVQEDHASPDGSTFPVALRFEDDESAKEFIEDCEGWAILTGSPYGATVARLSDGAPAAGAAPRAAKPPGMGGR